MAGKIRVAQVGLGALGRRLTPYLLERPHLELVAAVDPDPALVGQDLGRLAGLERPLGLTVSASPPFGPGGVDVAVLTTVSTLEQVRPQLEALLGLRANIVSSCEELSFPWATAPEWSAEVDRLAKEAGVSVLGAGVNPGFLMDYLPTALTAVCRRVDRVTVMRHQDAAPRRLPFQQKIGAGLTLEEFHAKLPTGSLRHVGLTESIHYIASRLGGELAHTEDVIEPILAEQEVRSAEIVVPVGRVAGVHQIGRGYVGEEMRIVLDFRAGLGEHSDDRIIIDGIPPLVSSIPGGVNGDIATCAILTNAVPTLLAAFPGLRTMADLPPIAWWA